MSNGQSEQSSQSHALRQDYICKVRYQNDLPPPPCPPKLLKYTTFDAKSSLSDPSLLTSAFRKENFKHLIPMNSDLGMPLDLIKVPGLIETNNNKYLLATKGQFQLHPDDAALLVDPQFYKMSKSQPVSFLRRTQYIAERSSSPSVAAANAAVAASKIPESNHSTSNLLAKKRKVDDETNAAAQVRAVEATFENAQELEETDLSKIAHPLKKKLKAKKVWNLLPDVSVIDKSFISLKFNGSASVTRSQPGGKLPPTFGTSIFRPVNTEQGEEWVSLFSTTEESSSQVKEKLDDITENIPIDEASVLDEAPEKYQFSHYRDYDMVFKRFENETEVAITFDKDSSTAYFSPINGRIDLKRRRVTPALEKLVKENTVDRIELSIREPTTGEAIARDNARSRYDPINYIEHEEEEEEALEAVDDAPEETAIIADEAEASEDESKTDSQE